MDRAVIRFKIDKAIRAVGGKCSPPFGGNRTVVEVTIGAAQSAVRAGVAVNFQLLLLRIAFDIRSKWNAIGTKRGVIDLQGAEVFCRGGVS